MVRKMNYCFSIITPPYGHKTADIFLLFIRGKEKYCAFFRCMKKHLKLLQYFSLTMSAYKKLTLILYAKIAFLSSNNVNSV